MFVLVGGWPGSGKTTLARALAGELGVAYVAKDEVTGEVAYVEHHRTLGDWVGLLARAGFRITRLVEPEWPAGHDRVWGGWSRTRGLLTPGTAIFAADLD